METENKKAANPVRKEYSLLINAVVAKDGKVLICQRSWQEKHGPGKWCIPGGKLEFTGVVHDALQKTAKREVLEETGIEIEDEVHLIANNTFEHDEDNLLVIAIVFFCHYKSGDPKALEDTIDVRWIASEEIDNFEFHNINVKNYIIKGFEFSKKNKKV